MTDNQSNSEVLSIRVMLVDDHEIWRDGVKSMLKESEFLVVGEAGGGREAIKRLSECSPRLVLLDIRMPEGDGFEALGKIKALDATIAVLMLSTYENPTFIAKAVAAGASGYLLKGCSRDELLGALRAVANGDTLISAEDLVRSLRSVSEATAESTDLFQPLTAREQEVLRLVATGLTNREIGSVLFISEGTAKTHIEHIIGKLGVSDRVQAAVWAARHGLASDET